LSVSDDERIAQLYRMSEGRLLDLIDSRSGPLNTAAITCA